MMPITSEPGPGLVQGVVADFEVELDTEPREVSVPADLAADLALDAGPKRRSSASPTGTSGA